MAKQKEQAAFDWSALIPKTFPVPLAELNPYENNPRINKKAIPYVKRSIKRFGFIVPIVIDSEETRVIAAGHTRLAAALELCEEEGKDPAKIRVLCLSAEHLTPSQIRQFRLADNRVASFSEDDAAKLKQELEELVADWDESEFGFDDDDWGKVGAEEEEDEEEGEVQFTEELLEEHNYLVLYFDNEVDWLQARTLFGVKKVKALDSKKGFEKAGVGRVINGAQALENLRKAGLE